MYQNLLLGLRCPQDRSSYIMYQRPLHAVDDKNSCQEQKFWLAIFFTLNWPKKTTRRHKDKEILVKQKEKIFIETEKNILIATRVRLFT